MIFIFDSYKSEGILVILITYFSVKVYYVMAHKNRTYLRKTPELKDFFIYSI